LNGLLSTTPILKVVDPYKYFTSCVDASKKRLGGVFSQGGAKEHERN